MEPCRLLSVAGINIRTLSVADTQQFGILRLIVSDWRRAAAILKDAGRVVNVTEVLAVEVPDRPGGLATVLDALEGSGINVKYAYALTTRREDNCALVFCFDDPDGATDILKKKGMNVVGGDDGKQEEK